MVLIKKKSITVRAPRFNARFEKCLLALLVISQTFLAIPYLRVVVIALLFGYAMVRSTQVPKDMRVSVWSNPFLTLTLAWSFLSVFWSVDAEASFETVVTSFAVLFIITHFKSVISHDEVFDGLAWGLKFLIIASVVVEYLHSHGVVLIEKDFASFQGVTANPNLLGFLAVVSIVVFLFQKNDSNGSAWLKTTFWVLSCLYLLFNADASAAPFYLLLTLAVMALVSVVRHRSHLAFPSLFLCIAFMVWATQDSVRAWGAALLGIDTNQTISGRTILWRASIEAIQERPLIGYGLTPFRELGLAPTNEMNRLWAIFDFTGFSSHNGYIELVLHIGLIGFALFISALIFGGIRSLKYSRLSYFSLLVVLVLYNLSEVRFFTPPLAWLLICIVIVGSFRNRNSGSKQRDVKQGQCPAFYKG